jgi:hypothetical protein
MRRADLVGQKFGRLLVINKHPHKYGKKGAVAWDCICDCGNLRTLVTNQVEQKTRSCGCLQIEIARKVNTRHGMRGTKVYNTWAQMKARCLNKRHFAFDKYGGRGITVQEEWTASFPSFYEYIGDPPAETSKWSLERIDNNKGYQEGNVKWATATDQIRNVSKNSRNKSGICGVSARITKGIPTSWRANWTEISGVRGEKSFSIMKYGNDLAFKLACEHRTKMIESLNQQGAGYSDSHGQDYK